MVRDSIKTRVSENPKDRVYNLHPQDRKLTTATVLREFQRKLRISRDQKYVKTRKYPMRGYFLDVLFT